MNSTLRISSKLLLAGAVVVSMTSCSKAQSSGGSFGERPSPTGSTPQTEFNSLPFRAANAQNAPRVQQQKAQPPIQLTAPGNSSRFGTPARSQVLATQASHGQAPGNRNLNSNPQEPNANYALPSYIDLDRCLVSFIDDIFLPARESGVIKSLTVKEGDYVPAGTLVGKIDDELYQRMLDQAVLRFELATEAANNEIAILAAEKKYDVASIEAQKTSSLADKGSKSESDRLMAIYTKEIASLEREQAVREKQKADGEQRLEAARLMEVRTHIKGHMLQSEFDAYVIKILKKPQEWVQQGEEVMRIARMDRLWVQGTIDIAELNPDEVRDRTVTITVDRARGQSETFEGKITNVGLETQGGTRYMVKAEVQNRPVGKHWVLQPLSSVKMRIHLGPPKTSEGTLGSVTPSK